MKYPIYLYIALKHPRTPGRIPSPVNGLSAADPVRTRPWCLCKPAGEWRGGRPADYRSDPVRCCASSPSTGSLSPAGVQSNTALSGSRDALANARSPGSSLPSRVRYSRADTRERLKHGKKNLEVNANLSNDAKDVVGLPERRLHKRYLSIIAGALRVCAAAHSRIARCVIPVQSPL